MASLNIPFEFHERTAYIEIRIKKINQLFNSFDPSPFMEKDLDDDAYEYIVSSVREIHLKRKQKILIHLPRNQKGKFSEMEVKQAIHNFFEYKKVLAERSIKLEMEEGQRSFVVGIIFLTSCLLTAEWIHRTYDSLFATILTEGLMIGGWVAMWKPISNVLYDWWPLSQEKKIFKKICEMDIDFVYYD